MFVVSMDDTTHKQLQHNTSISQAHTSSYALAPTTIAMWRHFRLNANKWLLNYTIHVPRWQCCTWQTADAIFF